MIKLNVIRTSLGDFYSRRDVSATEVANRIYHVTRYWKNPPLKVRIFKARQKTFTDEDYEYIPQSRIIR
jgi:hypothetical protein